MIRCEAKITKELKRGRHHSTPPTNPATPVKNLPTCWGEVTLRVAADLEPTPTTKGVVDVPVVTVVAICSRCRSAWWTGKDVLDGNPGLELATCYQLIVGKAQRAAAEAARAAWPDHRPEPQHADGGE